MTGPQPNARVSWKALLAILAAGAFLRVFHLNSDLWLDEIGTVVTYLRLPLSQIVRTYLSMNQHLLYSLLGRVSVDLFGESAWAVRLPAALFGIAAIPALYYTARAITSETESLWASAMLAASYHHIWFSQDARGYTGMVFWCLLGTGLLVRALANKRPTFWIGYTISMTLGVVTLMNTAFVVLGFFIGVTLLSIHTARSRLEMRAQVQSIALSTAAIVLLSLLCHGLMLRQIWDFTRHVDRAGLGFSNLSDFLPALSSGLVLGAGLAGLVAVSTLFAVGWIGYWRSAPLVATVLIFPVALNLALLVVLKIGAYPRSFLYELPFALLIAIRGIGVCSAKLHLPRFLPPALCAALLLLLSLPLARYYRLPKQDFTGALAYVNAHKQPGDRVMAADLAAVCYRKYYFPGIDVATSAEEFTPSKKPGTQVWVLYSFPREFQLRSPELFAFIRNSLQPVATFPGTLIGGDLYVARTRAAKR